MNKINSLTKKLRTMQTINFEIYEALKTTEKFTETEAKSIAKAISKSQNQGFDNLATKSDLKDLKIEMLENFATQKNWMVGIILTIFAIVIPLLIMILRK